jgi:pyruvate,water dikinase
MFDPDSPLVDLLDQPLGPTRTWTRVNNAEAFPGVPTPLTWDLIGRPADEAATLAWIRLGVFPRSMAVYPDNVDDRFVAISKGRALLNLDRMREVGDRMPGNSGDQIEASLFGTVREGLPNGGVPSRYPVVLAKTPLAFRCARKMVRALEPGTCQWWSDRTRRPLGLDDARVALDELQQRYVGVGVHQCVIAIAAQFFSGIVAKFCAQHELDISPDLLTTSDGVTAEFETVVGVWQLSRGMTSLKDFLARNGYHAPVQGEVALPSWRMDPAPVEALAMSYRARADAECPEEGQRRRQAQRDAAERKLLERAGRRTAPAIRGALALARGYVPLRQVGRLQWLQTFDVARAAAVVLADDLVARGLIDTPDDAYYLTKDELTGRVGLDRDVIAFRRARHRFYQDSVIPMLFTGRPTPTRPVIKQDTHFTGVAGSAGVYTGPARVVTDPDHVDALRDGEVLVCETTNPSWAAFFFMAGAVVCDIGASQSHGAILAREMGIPCVVNATNASRIIRSGDIVRVDGDRGEVRIEERTDSVSALSEPASHG